MRKFLWGLLIFIPFLSFSRQTEKKLEISPDVHFRMFWMSTSYSDPYKDDYVLGTSLNLGTKLTYSEHWKFLVGYRIFANLWSSGLTAPDPVSGGENRYEVGLFDLLDKKDRFFGKLENLSLTYSKESWAISAGRMAINEDWINAQDGRLSPTGIEGANAWLVTDSKWRFSVWGIGKVSVRGTSHGYLLEKALVFFPSGEIQMEKLRNTLERQIVTGLRLPKSPKNGKGLI